MSDFLIEYEKTKTKNYWCEQLGKYVKQCQGKPQCFECALTESQMKDKQKRGS